MTTDRVKRHFFDMVGAQIVCEDVSPDAICVVDASRVTCAACQKAIDDVWVARGLVPPNKWE